MGGNLNLVSWLVEVHGCPLSVRRDSKTGMFLSIQTSKSRTLIDLAMSGKPKIEVLSYLVKNNLSVIDTKDKSLAPHTLQLLLGAGFRFEKRDDEALSECLVVESSEMSAATLEDAVSFSPLLIYNCLNYNCLTLVPVRHLLRTSNGLRPHAVWTSSLLLSVRLKAFQVPNLQGGMQCVPHLSPLNNV